MKKKMSKMLCARVNTFDKVLPGLLKDFIIAIAQSNDKSLRQIGRPVFSREVDIREVFREFVSSDFLDCFEHQAEFAESLHTYICNVRDGKGKGGEERTYGECDAVADIETRRGGHIESKRHDALINDTVEPRHRS
jgi:hypothetical protein